MGVAGWSLKGAVAFTKEESFETASETLLPDRPISSHPNLVTETGLRIMEMQLKEAREAYEIATLSTMSTSAAARPLGPNGIPAILSPGLEPLNSFPRPLYPTLSRSEIRSLSAGLMAASGPIAS